MCKVHAACRHEDLDKCISRVPGTCGNDFVCANRTTLSCYRANCELPSSTQAQRIALAASRGGGLGEDVYTPYPGESNFHEWAPAGNGPAPGEQLEDYVECGSANVCKVKRKLKEEVLCLFFFLILIFRLSASLHYSPRLPSGKCLEGARVL